MASWVRRVKRDTGDSVGITSSRSPVVRPCNQHETEPPAQPATHRRPVQQGRELTPPGISAGAQGIAAPLAAPPAPTSDLGRTQKPVTTTRVTRAILVAATLAFVVLAGCRATGQDRARGDVKPPARTQVIPTESLPAANTCRFRHRDGQPLLPDPSCTPGATDPAVSQQTIGSTICRAGWTKSVRPPEAVTNRMKAESARSYDVARSVHGEYDHLVPLELGGAPEDPRNLWFEPGTIPNPKDAVENTLNDAVCVGLVPLRTAQSAIADNWVTAFDAAGLVVANGHVFATRGPVARVGGMAAPVTDLPPDQRPVPASMRRTARRT